MTWNEKVRKLYLGGNYAALSRQTGWSYKTLKNSVKAGNMPKADKAIRLARALGVRAEWLFDDNQGWPPPTMVGPANPKAIAANPALKAAMIQVLHEVMHTLAESGQLKLVRDDKNPTE